VLSTVNWGKFSGFLNRLLISVVSVVVWLWHLFWRRVPDVVFFRDWSRLLLAGVQSCGLVCVMGNTATSTAASSVVEYWMSTEELIGTEETVNNKGDLVIVENRSEDST